MQESIHTLNQTNLRSGEKLFGHNNATVQIYRSANTPARGLVIGGLGDFDPTADNPLFRKMLKTCGNNSEDQVLAATVFDTPIIKHDEFHGIGDPTGVLNVLMVKDFMESFIQFAQENGSQFQVTANSLGGALFMTSYLASIKILTNHKHYLDQRVKNAQKFLESLSNNVTDAVIYSPSIVFQDYPNFQAQVIRDDATHTPYYTPLKPFIRWIASTFGTNRMKSGRLLQLTDQEKLEHAEEKSESLVLMGKAWKKLYKSLPKKEDIDISLQSIGIYKLPTIVTVISEFDHQLKYKILNHHIEPLEKNELTQVLRLNEPIWKQKLQSTGKKPDMHSPFMNDELWEELWNRIEPFLKKNK